MYSKLPETATEYMVRDEDYFITKRYYVNPGNKSTITKKENLKKHNNKF